jgi:hypothetical protein
MNKKINVNYKKILLISIPILVAGLSTGCYFIFKNQDQGSGLPIAPEENDIEKDKEVFPIIKQSDFYHLIEFENGKPFIGDKMMAAIIKDVITRLGSVNGDIHFYITENSITEKTIYFK